MIRIKEEQRLMHKSLQLVVVSTNQRSWTHALSCKKGGFVTLRHNEIRDVTAKMIGEFWKDVRTEPLLQQLSGEKLNSTSNVSKNARLDISATGFWVSGQ